MYAVRRARIIIIVFSKNDIIYFSRFTIKTDSIRWHESSKINL